MPDRYIARYVDLTFRIPSTTASRTRKTKRGGVESRFDIFLLYSEETFDLRMGPREMHRRLGIGTSVNTTAYIWVDAVGDTLYAYTACWVPHPMSHRLRKGAVRRRRRRKRRRKRGRGGERVDKTTPIHMEITRQPILLPQIPPSRRDDRWCYCKTPVHADGRVDDLPSVTSQHVVPSIAMLFSVLC